MRDGYARDAPNSNDRVDIARILPENLLNASSSTFLEAGCLDFLKARSPSHSTSKNLSESQLIIFFGNFFKYISHFLLATEYGTDAFATAKVTTTKGIIGRFFWTTTIESVTAFYVGSSQT